MVSYFTSYCLLTKKGTSLKQQILETNGFSMERTSRRFVTGENTDKILPVYKESIKEIEYKL